jgi:hypothetical protein
MPNARRHARACLDEIHVLVGPHPRPDVDEAA